jgi:hypothetical protein
MIGRISMTETFTSMIAMIVALFAAFGSAIVIAGALIAWQDWQRQKASLNSEADRGHRLDGIRQHPKPRF